MVHSRVGLCLTSWVGLHTIVFTNMAWEGVVAEGVYVLLFHCGIVEG